ncbi:Response regulator PleD [Pelagimonas phthalicica]|uniref:guanylate cyclase n=1 Tax=Pelagimonas phthalicica TaxID=1037362 RepID=A0A238JFE7_9RHOB|nr:GGDEF domain-containing protein [Pelagimonas phthalicica]TDS92308.1 diguanylate cyclase (GGDEF)-like protein [Pelagimonas phthalicica]SMX29369.1 Response regulator PleD [Pelagimonas phthalicica]
MNRFPIEMLHRFCPMHAVLDSTGHIRQAGPTLHKICGDNLEGKRFLEIFEIYRPRAVVGMGDLLKTEGRKLHLRLRHGVRTPVKGVLGADGNGGAVINLSFGISVIDAVRDYSLTSTDFAPTDLAVEMLYLVEAKSAAMDASRNLNTRLQGAMVAAEKRAFTDTLTGLHNRRAVDQVLDRICRSGQPFSLMHIDLDFFKQVNDTMGHAAGDHVLKACARAMLDTSRKDDTAARVGGDEFVIIYTTLTNRSRLSDLAGHLISRIEQPIPFEGQDCNVSASIGVFSSDGSVTDPALVMERADVALYAAKRAGRAQYCFFDDIEAASDDDQARAANGE